MNENNFAPVSVYALPADADDLDLFDPRHDLPLEHTGIPLKFDASHIESNIENGALCARLQVEITSALMLAELFHDDPERHQAHMAQALDSARRLGAASPTGIACPYEVEALANAWQQGHGEAASHRTAPQSSNSVEARLWNDGIDTETGNNHFELAALSLLHLASISADANQRQRAGRLAREMLAYQSGAVPAPRRQQEIDRYMKVLTGRLANAIDLG